MQAPADKIVNRTLPLLTVGNIEHADLQPGNDNGTVAQVPVCLVLVQLGRLGTLLLQLFGQPVCLWAVYQPTCRHEVVDIRLQSFVECCVILPVDRLLGTDFLIWNRLPV